METNSPSTEKILELLEKWQPEEVKNIPAGDHYGLRSIQDIVVTTVRHLSIVILTWVVYALFAIVYAPQLEPDADPAFRGFAGGLLTALQLVAWCVVIAAVWKPITELIGYRIRPLYISKTLGQMFVGQRGYAIFGMSDSRPDTADLKGREVITPDQPWYIRWFFWSNQQVMLPKNDKREKAYIIIVPQAAADKLYAIQGFYQGMQATAVQVPEKSLEVHLAMLEAIKRLPDVIVDKLSGLTLNLSDDTVPIPTPVPSEATQSVSDTSKD